MVAAGAAVTITLMVAGALATLLIVCVTVNVVVPATVVVGVGAVADEAVPAVTLVHLRLLPEAVKAVATAFWQ